jgi:hypothetical protein
LPQVWQIKSMSISRSVQLGHSSHVMPRLHSLHRGRHPGPCSMFIGRTPQTMACWRTLWPDQSPGLSLSHKPYMGGVVAQGHPTHPQPRTGPQVNHCACSGVPGRYAATSAGQEPPGAGRIDAVGSCWLRLCGGLIPGAGQHDKAPMLFYVLLLELIAEVHGCNVVIQVLACGALCFLRRWCRLLRRLLR